MFYVLAVLLCFAVLFLVLAASFLLLLPAVPLIRRAAQKLRPQAAANLLFAVRLLPFLLAALVTLSLALPAFLEFEPSSTTEGTGLRLDVLAFAGALIVLGILLRGSYILLRTARTERRWRTASRAITVEGVSLPVYCVEHEPSLLAVAGIFRSRILVAREITGLLSSAELKAAMAHEFAHVSSFDNLKQLLLRITGVPPWLRRFSIPDREWAAAAEVAADHRALARGISALDLSSALVKVARLQRPAHAPVIASHLVPACGSSLEQRVMKLTELLRNDTPIIIAETASRRPWLVLSCAVLVYISLLPVLLPAVHEALEVLVR